MSWSITAAGRPESVVKAIEEMSAKQTGQCKVEFDAAMPAMIALVRQNFNNAPGSEAGVKLQAHGSGYSREGAQIQRSCKVSVEPIDYFVG
jgi:hypothetical protein